MMTLGRLCIGVVKAAVWIIAIPTSTGVAAAFVVKGYLTAMEMLK